MEACFLCGCSPLLFWNPGPCVGQKLDRHSTIKPNEECVFNEEGGSVGRWVRGNGWKPTSWNLLHMQACRQLTRQKYRLWITSTIVQPLPKKHTRTNTPKVRGDQRSKVFGLEGISSEKWEPCNSSCIWSPGTHYQSLVSKRLHSANGCAFGAKRIY